MLLPHDATRQASNLLNLENVCLRLTGHESGKNYSKQRLPTPFFPIPTGKYRYTFAVGLEGGIVALDKPGDVGNEIVAAWHTHPEGGTPDFTRPHDLQDGRKNYLGLPGCKGILMYVPDPALDYNDRTMRIKLVVLR